MLRPIEAIMAEFQGRSRRDMAERIQKLEYLAALQKLQMQTEAELRAAGMTDAQLSDAVRLK